MYMLLAITAIWFIDFKLQESEKQNYHGSVTDPHYPISGNSQKSRYLGKFICSLSYIYVPS